ncbi:hypothetical protein HWV62_22724, partial [Athelia sp. TMB]
PAHAPLDTDGRAIYGKTPLTPALTARFPPGALQNITLVKPPTGAPALFLEAMRFPAGAAEAQAEAGLPPVADYVYWVLAARSATFALPDAALFALGSAETAALSLTLTADWAPAIRALLELQDVAQTSALRIGSFAPAIPAWAPDARVTLLGDAAHAMSPSGGVGANTALRDAQHLCAALVAGGGAVGAEAVGAYEDAMRVYAREAIEGSYHGGKRIYGQLPFEECKPLEL